MARQEVVGVIPVEVPSDEVRAANLTQGLKFWQRQPTDGTGATDPHRVAQEVKGYEEALAGLSKDTQFFGS